MTSPMKDVLPLSCSCTNCDWKLCTMKTKINKDILVCCCGENNRFEQCVYTCHTCSGKEGAKPIQEPERCYRPKDLKKRCNERDEKIDNKNETPKKDVKKSSKDRIDSKQAGNKSQKSVKKDLVSKQSKTIFKGKNKTSQETKDKQNIIDAHTKTKVKRNDLYSKIEEIYKICCCELCVCPPSPPSRETYIGDENLDNLDEINGVCLCSQNYKEGSDINNGDEGHENLIKSLESGPSKACSCNAIDKEAMVEEQSNLSSLKPSKTDLINAKSNKTCRRPESQTKQPSCGQVNSPCVKKQEKEVKIILPSQGEENQRELSKKKEHTDCWPCRNKDNDMQVVDERNMDTSPEATSFPTPVEALSLSCSCADSDISEDGYPICACQPDDIEDEQCSCNSDEMPKTNFDESLETTKESCKCNSCKCVSCENCKVTDKTAEIKVKKCPCTKCVNNACRKDHNNCVCRRRSAPNRKRKSKAQIHKYDIRRILVSENLPFKTREISVCNKESYLIDKRKNRPPNGFTCKNNLHEYVDNIINEGNRCGCSPCECQFCNNNVADDNSGLENNTACRCAQCDCISCSNTQYDKHVISNTNDKRHKKQNKISCTTKQETNENMNKVKSNYSDILYENLILLKKGEIVTKSKSIKEKLVSDQIRLGLNKNMSLPYVVFDETVQVINKDDNLKPNSKEKIKESKNISKRKEQNKNIPCHKPVSEKSLTVTVPKSDSNVANKEENVRNDIKIYIQLKNLCDYADKYIEHLKNILDKSKSDYDNFESIVEKIKSIRNKSYVANNLETKMSRLLQLLPKEASN